MIILLTLVLILPAGFRSETIIFSYRDTIINHIFNNYKSNERPSENKQTLVTVYMKVLAINSVDVIKMEYSTDVYLRQEWTDERLAWDHIDNLKAFNSNVVSPFLKDKLWLPDLFFRNGKEGYVHSMTTPNFLMRLKPNGEVLYSQKITMKFSCQMDLQTFPMDTQECNMDIGSYGYTLDQLKFQWRSWQPMILPQVMQIPEFNQPTNIQTIDCSELSSTSTGEYTCIKATFFLQRQLGSYLASTYIPNVLIVMVSWLNFWVSIDAVPARITLGLLTLLGILTQATGMSANLPRVSYIKAIDVWIIACIIFVIGALIEFAVASMISRKSKSELWQRNVQNIVHQELYKWSKIALKKQQSISFLQMHLMNSPNRNPGINLAQMNLDNHDNNDFYLELEILLTAQLLNANSNQLMRKSSSKPLVTEPPVQIDSEIDGYSQFLFPAFFMLYNCFYWLYYLILVHKRNIEMGLVSH